MPSGGDPPLRHQVEAVALAQVAGLELVLSWIPAKVGDVQRVEVAMVVLVVRPVPFCHIGGEDVLSLEALRREEQDGQSRLGERAKIPAYGDSIRERRGAPVDDIPRLSRFAGTEALLSHAPLGKRDDAIPLHYPVGYIGGL